MNKNGEKKREGKEIPKALAESVIKGVEIVMRGQRIRKRLRLRGLRELEFRVCYAKRYIPFPNEFFS